MQTCGMCGLAVDTTKALHDHTTRTHDLTPAELDEALGAGKAKTDEAIAKAWERHARHHGAHLPLIGQGDPVEAASETTVDSREGLSAMRPGGYL